MSVWLSVDAMAHKEPNITPYAYVGNNPVMFVDPDGRFRIAASFKKYKSLTRFLNNDGLLKYVNQNSRISEGLRAFGQNYSDGSPYFTSAKIKSTFKTGSGPKVSAEDFSGYTIQPNAQTWRENSIEFNQDFLSGIDKVLSDPNASEVDKQGALLKFIVTATHEPIHSSEDGTGGKTTDGEMGEWFESFGYGNADVRNLDDNFDYEGYNKFQSWQSGETSNADFMNYLKEAGRESLIPDVSEFTK